MNIRTEKQNLIIKLKDIADPVRAANEKKYLKSELNFYGVNAAGIDKIAKEWRREHAAASAADILALAAALWDSNWHEQRSLALELLYPLAPKLDTNFIPQIERMQKDVNTWAHLDDLAIHIVGIMFLQGAISPQKLLEWSTHKNFWVRRTAILAHIPHFRKNQADMNLFEQIVLPNFNEQKSWDTTEKFFIRKAIGWALRELVKHNPAQVVTFVKKHKNKMSGLTLREATRNLSSQDKKTIEE